MILVKKFDLSFCLRFQKLLDEIIVIFFIIKI